MIAFQLLKMDCSTVQVMNIFSWYKSATWCRCKATKSFFSNCL